MILALLQALVCGWGLRGLQMCQLRAGENYFLNARWEKEEIFKALVCGGEIANKIFLHKF